MVSTHSQWSYEKIGDLEQSSKLYYYGQFTQRTSLQRQDLEIVPIYGIFCFDLVKRFWFLEAKVLLNSENKPLHV